jgi:hypothetical protein
VDTGTEEAPGRKDARKVREFILNARRADPPRYHGDEETRPFDWQEEDR